MEGSDEAGRRPGGRLRVATTTFEWLHPRRPSSVVVVVVGVGLCEFVRGERAKKQK